MVWDKDQQNRDYQSMARVTSRWLPSPDILDLGLHQVDIWRICLDLEPASVKQLESTLSAEESQRAARFRFPEGTKRYIIAHGSLRDILARYLDSEPGQLSFSTGEYGKPVFEDHKLEFNLSHSSDFALVAVTRERKVGVDVECHRPDLEHEKIASRFFSPNEVAKLITLPLEQRIIGFFNCWTRKEAYIKAHGLGLSMPLDSFDVSLTPNEPAILQTTRLDQEEAARWTLVSLDVSSGYAAAIAVERQNLEFRLWDWNKSIR